MKIAIPLFDSRISPRFDYARRFLLGDVENGAVIKRNMLPTEGLTSLSRIKKLIEIGVDILICGGIDETSAWKLQFHEVKLYAWVTGEAEDALSCFLRGELESGVMIAADGHRCGMWKFKRNGAPWNNDPGGPARVRRQGEGHGRGRRRGRSRF